MPWYRKNGVRLGCHHPRSRGEGWEYDKDDEDDDDDDDDEDDGNHMNKVN